MTNAKIVENIQILLYKENIELLKKLNLEKEDVFFEPLFNSKKTL